MKNWKTFIITFSFLLLIPVISVAQDHQTWSYNKIIYEVNVRQYTAAGTFAAFESHLERLQELGVGILWFMPIHPIGVKNRLGTLGSYYSVKDYYGVNPEFGTMEDFKSVVAKAHQLGMYVLIDWVANHTAWDNGLTITHPEWYTKDAYGNFMPPAGTNWSDVIDLNYSQQGLRNYMIDAMKFWIEEADIDGFRCDATGWVPLDFWTTAIAELKNVKPEILMLAEDDDQQYQYAGFDMSYAWGYHGFGGGILIRLADGSSDVNELANYVTGEQINYPNGHYRMYFTSNHDENSWYGTVFEQFGDAAEVFGVLTSIFNGMPLLYSGQEAGLNKRLQFFEKDQINWQEHPFAEIYKTLFNLRKENKALWNGLNGGKLQRVTTSHQEDIFAFVREKDDDKIFAVLNLSPDFWNITLLDTLCNGYYADVFTSDTVSFEQGKHVTLVGWTYKVYREIEKMTAITENKESPKKFLVSQNYPNPFNPTTTIKYSIPKSEKITLAIYNVMGQKIETLINEIQNAGNHQITWTAQGLPGGIYLYRLQAGAVSETRKLILQK